METARVDLSVKQGDTFQKLLSFSKNGQPMDVTEYEMTAQLKEYAGDTGAPEATFSVLPGPQSHQVYLRLEADDELVARDYWWELQWVTPGGDVETPFEGTFTIRPQGTVP